MKYLRYLSRALLFCAAIFISSCATTPKYSLYDVQQNELTLWFAEAKALVEQERGLDLSNVTLSAVDSREMLFVLSELYGKKLDPHMTADTRVRVFADKAFEDVKSVQAVYDPFAKKIVVNQQNLKYYIGLLTDRGIDARNAAMTLLIHELIHAADDQEYDLVAIEKRHRGDTLGVFMVAEGHAEMQTESMCAKAGCSKAFRTAQIEFHGVDPEDTDQLLLTSQDNNGLVYVQGRKFLKALAARDSDGSLVKQALTKPPGDVLEFFDPANFPDTKRASRRDKIYQILNSVEIESAEGPLLKIPQAVFNESDFPVDQNRRLKYVRDYKRKTLASGSMNYIEQYARKLNSVYVTLYEASSPNAAYEIQQQLIGERQDLTSSLRNRGADIKHPKTSELRDIYENMPAKTELYIVNFRNRDSGETLQFNSSYLIEGSHLIVVSNTNDNELNREALTKTLQSLRIQTSL